MKIILLALMMPLVLFGCGEAETATQTITQNKANLSSQSESSVSTSNSSVKPVEDSVKVLSAAPSTTAALKAGSTVKMRFDVQYSLASKEKGTLELVIQDSANEALEKQSYPVSKGKGVQTLKTEVVVPESNSIKLMITLTPEGSANESIVESKSYKVES